jgi:hypothetical protein
MRTPRGRIATANVYKHFGLRAPEKLGKEAPKDQDEFQQKDFDLK